MAYRYEPISSSSFTYWTPPAGYKLTYNSANRQPERLQFQEFDDDFGAPPQGPYGAAGPSPFQAPPQPGPYFPQDEFREFGYPPQPPQPPMPSMPPNGFPRGPMMPQGPPTPGYASDFGDYPAPQFHGGPPPPSPAPSVIGGPTRGSFVDVVDACPDDDEDDYDDDSYDSAASAYSPATMGRGSPRGNSSRIIYNLGPVNSPPQMHQVRPGDFRPPPVGRAPYQQDFDDGSLFDDVSDLGDESDGVDIIEVSEYEDSVADESEYGAGPKRRYH